MAGLASRRRFDGGQANYWPGFVDAMATLLLVIMFLLTVFMLAQFLLAREISGRDTALVELRNQLAELTDMLALEQASTRSLQVSLAGLTDDLTAAEDERTRLAGLLAEAETGRSLAEERIVVLRDQLDSETQGRLAALSELEQRQRTIVDLRSESEQRQALIASLTTERDAARAETEEAQALAATRESVIVDLRSEAEKRAAELAARQFAAETARAEARSARGETARAEQQIRVLSSELEQTEAERTEALARLAAAQDELVVIQSERDRELARLQGEVLSATARADDAEEALAETDEQRQLIIDLRRDKEQSGRRITRLSGSLQTAEDARNKALQDIEILNSQLAALRSQLAALQSALDASEERDVEQKAQIADLGRRLNVALAQKVKELSRYRSEFFGKLRQILSNRSDIRVVGDRFVFQSEVLFPSASATINTAGRNELDKLAEAIIELEREIPPEINWVLRVDGHTDQRPISNFIFESNWELSSARAISVVQHLIAKGVAPNRLVAAGFGEFQPLDTGENEAAFSRNRRIELKLTER